MQGNGKITKTISTRMSMEIIPRTKASKEIKTTAESTFADRNEQKYPAS